MPGKASGAREEIYNLSLNCCIEEIQSVCIAFVNREFRQCKSAELVKVFFGPDLHILKLPNFFKALHTVDYRCDFSDESERNAPSRTASPENKHGFLPLLIYLVIGARGASSSVP